MTAFPVDIIEGPIDVWNLVAAGVATLVSLAALIVAVTSSVLSRKDASAAIKRADAAEAALLQDRAQQDLERRASAARKILLEATYLETEGSLARVRVRVTNRSADAITRLEIGGWDNALPRPDTETSRQINPVRDELRPSGVYADVWTFELPNGERLPQFAPIVATFTDVFLQTWQLANGQHLRLVGSSAVIESDLLPHLRASQD